MKYSRFLLLSAVTATLLFTGCGAKESPAPVPVESETIAISETSTVPETNADRGNAVADINITEEEEEVKENNLKMPEFTGILGQDEKLVDQAIEYFDYTDPTIWDQLKLEGHLEGNYEDGFTVDNNWIELIAELSPFCDISQLNESGLREYLKDLKDYVDTIGVDNGKMTYRFMVIFPSIVDYDNIKEPIKETPVKETPVKENNTSNNNGNTSNNSSNAGSGASSSGSNIMSQEEYDRIRANGPQGEHAREDVHSSEHSEKDNVELILH